MSKLKLLSRDFHGERYGDNRRRFLRFLAGSAALPWLSRLGSAQEGSASSISAQHDQDPEGIPPVLADSLQQFESHIASASDAINVFDLEAVARRKLNVGHVAYLTSIEDQQVSRNNREGFKRYQVRSRRLTGVSKADTSATLFGETWKTPLLLCPAAYQGAFSPEAEVAVAHAAKSRQHLQVLSNMATRPIEEVTEARGQPVWFQLYQNRNWNETRAMIKRAEVTGSPVLVFTVDTAPGSSRELLAKVRRTNMAFCESCHAAVDSTESLSNQLNGVFGAQSYPMASTPPLGPPLLDGPATWDYLKRLRDATHMKIVLKGIVTHEDAERGLEHGADGIWVSNHGGMQEDSGRSTIQSLSEVAAGVRGRKPIIVDGGFRRGSDIFKALGLGASAVGIGRPYLWGLAAFGQQGVEAALDILDYELQTYMVQVGAANLQKIDRSFVFDDMQLKAR